jgi:hypothetical protein
MAIFPLVWLSIPTLVVSCTWHGETDGADNMTGKNSSLPDSATKLYWLIQGVHEKVPQIVKQFRVTLRICIVQLWFGYWLSSDLG